MKPTLTIGNAVVYHGSNLDVLPTLADNSVDSIVCDPPYELGFMGKKWDSSGIAYSVELWTECLRVLKPGGHLLAFGGSRTWHRLAVAIEDAGFEVRDSIAWLYGSGFPKSMDIAKAIDKQNGYEGKVIGTELVDVGMQGGHMHTGRERSIVERSIVERSIVAKKWQGWGTALKPAFEPVVVARKPLAGKTVAANMLEWGTGGLNIDGSRIGTEILPQQTAGQATIGTFERSDMVTPERTGRWPANIILDEYTAGLLDEQSGVSTSLAHNRPHSKKWGFGVNEDNAKEYDYATGQTGYGDTGGASRFFYVAKASKKDRNEGLDDLEAQRHADRVTTDGVGGDNPRNRTNHAKQNFHPTVKPTAIMEYLIKLVTPPNGIVLDPFTGSGSTGKAALLNGYQFIGIELTEEYLPIIEGRLTHAMQTYKQQAIAKEEEESETLF